MTKYRLTETGYFCPERNSYIPNDPDNRGYQKVQEWIAAGNTPDPYIAPIEPSREDQADAQFDSSDTLAALVEVVADLTSTPKDQVREKLRQAISAMPTPQA
jgi:hypothetical protein